METVTVELTNTKALKLLKDLEDLHIIKLLKKNAKPAKKKLSEKYSGILSKEEGEDLNKHINQMRSEWNNS